MDQDSVATSILGNVTNVVEGIWPFLSKAAVILQQYLVAITPADIENVFIVAEAVLQRQLQRQHSSTSLTKNAREL